ncbi:MAG: ribonuclease HII [Myxococcota bacterium]
MRVLGIDEAGRGCVLGDLVVAGFVVDDPDDLSLRAAGAADSKVLAPAKRAAARVTLTAFGRAEIRRVSARQIDDGNLNALEEDAIVELISEARPDRVRVDALGHPNALPGITRRLLSRLPRGLRPELVIEPKADATYAEVGAASIFAKTLRDELLDEWRAEFGDFGSGYPSDPKTRDWLRQWSATGRDWPSFVRRRWSTVTDISQGALF